MADQNRRITCIVRSKRRGDADAGSSAGWFTELLSVTVGMSDTFSLIRFAAYLLPSVGAAVGARNLVDLTSATRCDYGHRIVAFRQRQANPSTYFFRHL